MASGFPTHPLFSSCGVGTYRAPSRSLAAAEAPFCRWTTAEGVINCCRRTVPRTSVDPRRELRNLRAKLGVPAPGVLRMEARSYEYAPPRNGTNTRASNTMDKGLYDCTVSYQLLTKLSVVLTCIYAPQATNDIKCVGFGIRSSYENSKNPVDGVREKRKQASRKVRRRWCSRPLRVGVVPFGDGLSNVTNLDRSAIQGQLYCSARPATLHHLTLSAAKVCTACP